MPSCEITLIDCLVIPESVGLFEGGFGLVLPYPLYPLYFWLWEMD